MCKQEITSEFFSSYGINVARLADTNILFTLRLFLWRPCVLNGQLQFLHVLWQIYSQFLEIEGSEDEWTVYVEKVFFLKCTFSEFSENDYNSKKNCPAANCAPYSKNCSCADQKNSYRLAIQSVKLVFLSQLCKLFPSNLLSGSTLPPFPDSVWLGGGGGVDCWVLLETIFCRSLTFYIWPDSEPTN